jgi:3-hydroxyacyl-CoA dehydrogenase
MSLVSCQAIDRVAVITIDNPPVNAIGREVQEQLQAQFREANSDASVLAIVLIGARSTFIAGADIKALRKMAAEGQSHSKLPGLLVEIEAAGKPVIAALRGNALGGGLETAMAAHYRIASPGTKLGQPEVKLGLIPGAGGTQRLPRLVGVEKAIEMCVYGDPVPAEQASQVGLVDRIVEGDLLREALDFARELAGQPITRTCARPIPPFDGAIFEAARKQARTARKNLSAPLAAIDAVEAATVDTFEKGCAKERDLFLAQLRSSEAKALMHVFFAERAAAKGAWLSQEGEPASVGAATVIGAGTMGRGIAMCFANAGIPVRLKETNQSLLDSAMASIRSLYEASAAKGRISADQMAQRLSRIVPQLDYAGFAETDLILEAAFENLEVKQRIFREVSAVARPDAILATNTSYLSVDQIASAVSRPEFVIGLHFFSPANVMRLLEVIPGAATSNRVLAASMALARKLGKLAVVAGNCPGFIGNRMLRAYRREAQLLIEEGASPREVDAALEDFGMAMGPFAAQDLAGIDIAMSSRAVFAGMDPVGSTQPRVIEKLFELGRYGVKTGAGWYRYDDKRKTMPDPAVDAIVASVAREAGIQRRPVEPARIVERTVYALVNEGARVLEEGHALRASDIDLVYINGYGFPAYRGGPMRFADSVGLREVRERVLQFQAPSPLLKRLAESGDTFANWDESRNLPV